MLVLAQGGAGQAALELVHHEVGHGHAVRIRAVRARVLVDGDTVRMTPDVAAATAFYAAALGWTFTEQNMGEGGIYTLAHVPSQEMPVAGIYEWPESQPGSRDWLPYVAVDDVDADAFCNAVIAVSA